MSQTTRRPSWPGVLAGVVLALAGLATVTSGELVRRDVLAELDAMGGVIIDVGPGSDLQDLDGQLVRVHGKLKVDRPARDRQFGVEAMTSQLKRTVEMEQWREVKDSQGGVSYVRNWYDHPIDSSRFKRPAGHQNPPFPFHDASFHGGNPTLGGLLLGPEMRDTLPGNEPVEPDYSTLPPNLTASFRLADGKLWSNTHPGSPKLGDLRLSWSKRPLRELSIVARAEHHVLRPAPHLPPPGYVLMVGDVPLDTMMPGLPQLPGTTWLWRILGLALAMAGTWMLLAAWKRQSPAPTLALPAGVLPVSLVAAIVWLGIRWQFTGVWFLLAALAAAVLVWELRFRTDREGATT
ncbi:MAG: TMEM43 family protein [Rhodanobacteraceae bacterium]